MRTVKRINSLQQYISTLDYFVDTELDSNYTKLLPSLQNLSNKPLSVGEAAAFCNLSKSHFAHIFSKVFGMPLLNMNAYID